jgi:hypothetical protein
MSKDSGNGALDKFEDMSTRLAHPTTWWRSRGYLTGGMLIGELVEAGESYRHEPRRI